MSLRFLLCCLCPLLLSACGTPAKIGLPSTETIQEGRERLSVLSGLPPSEIYILPGDVLHVVRDAQNPTAQKDEMKPFVVRPDGNISVPFIGKLHVAGHTPEEIAAEITDKFGSIYLEPTVTVNIAESPGNRAYVGGEVRNPSVYPLNGPASIEQAILGVGGVLPSADSENVALLRQNRDGKYIVYFFDYAGLLKPSEGEQKTVMLQRGDIVFVPKSGLGNAVEAVDMYFTKLIPINKGVGLGFNYDLNRQSGDVTFPSFSGSPTK